MTDSVEAQALGEIETLPTNNITRIFRHVDRLPPVSVGGGCMWMAARLAKLLRQRKPGIAITHYDLGSPGSHTTIVSDDGTGRLLYEPSLFQVQPFPLAVFEADPTQCYSDTHPVNVQFPARLKFTWITPGKVLEMALVSVRGYPNRAFQYLVDPPQPVVVNEDDPYGGLPFIDQQEQVYVYALAPDGSKHSVTMNVRTRRINVARVGDRMYVDSEPGFGSRFERFAERVGLSEHELRTMLGEAVEIHNGVYKI